MHLWSARVPALAAFLLLLPPASPVVAIVSMENLHLRDPKEGYSGNAELAFSGSSGTADKRDLLLAGRLEWRHGPHDDFLILSHTRGEALGVENTNRSFLHYRHIWQRDAKLAWEGFAQGERDRFRRLSFRGLIGAGARLTLLDKTDQQAAFLGLGVMGERERYTALASGAEEAPEDTTRANLYLVYKYRFRPGIRMINTLYYQPAFSDRSDYRLFDTFAFQVDLTRQLALQISIDVTHQSRPPATVEKTETIWRTGLNWSF